MIPKKLPPIPKSMLNTDCVIALNAPGLDENGKPVAGVTFSGKCAFSEKRKQVMNAEKHIIQLEGQAVLSGDIAPTLKTPAGGTFTANGITYTIYAVKRPRNPNGSVHHTSLELM